MCVCVCVFTDVCDCVMCAGGGGGGVSSDGGGGGVQRSEAGGGGNGDEGDESGRTSSRGITGSVTSRPSSTPRPASSLWRGGGLDRKTRNKRSSDIQVREHRSHCHHLAELASYVG